MLKIKDIVGLPSLDYHLENGLTLSENVYRYSSERFIQLFAEARDAWRDGLIELNEEDTQLLESTDIGEYGVFEGEKVPLDLPMVHEAEYQGRKVSLGKPTRGDVKKFKVYVKNDKGNVVKVNFGDPHMRIKTSNPKRRKSFRARNRCASAKDIFSSRYWSCKKW